MKYFYQKSIIEISREFNTDLSEGLTSNKITEHIDKYGKNAIELSKQKSILIIFFEQLINPIVLILIGATIIAAITGEIFESLLILGIVLFMALIGTFLENKAGNAVEKLKSYAVLFTTVIREGKLIQIKSEDVVPGDLVLLNEGDRIPADGRIIEINDFQTDEAILTGESLPSSKSVDIINDIVTVGDQKNMVFSGTYVIQGKAKVIITSTGINTELGGIATKLAEIDTKDTPLQIQLEKLSKYLLWLTLGMCGIILAITVIRGQKFVDALIQALSLAIAFIPEGLSAVMTVTLAIGVKEMVKKNVIIKRLIAAEGLGSVSILATDKTGTITEGKMTVEKLWMYDKEVHIENFKPTNSSEKKVIDIIRYCNNSKGATEIALISFLEKIGLEFELEERIVEHRFSSNLKRMMVVKKGEKNVVGYSKGAPDILLPLCSRYIDPSTDKEFIIDEHIRNKILDSVNEYAKQGYRVLCLAHKNFDKEHQIGKREKDESELCFIGLIGLMDPIRKEVRSTVSKLLAAGVRPIIITGDHKEIARTIAINAGIINKESTNLVIEGKELDDFFSNKGSLSKEDIFRCSVFARVSPEHKNQLVDYFKNSGHIAAMAGDGVNDAVAISKANIGIAVSNGADIVKESADVIITGTYDALCNAVEVGRVIMQRTRLYLHYILSGNFCEVGVFILALVFNKPLPLTAIGLLLINLLTDAAPAMAMAFEKGDSSLMKQKPRSSNENIINKAMWSSICVQGTISSIFLYIVFLLTLPHGLIFAQSATFTAYIFQKLLRAFTARSFHESILQYGFFSNKATLLSVVFSISIWAIVVYALPHTFEMVKINTGTLILIFSGALIFPIIEEIIKYFNKIKLRSNI